MDAREASLVGDSIDTTAEFHTGLLWAVRHLLRDGNGDTVNLLHDALRLGFTPSALLMF